MARIEVYVQRQKNGWGLKLCGQSHHADVGPYGAQSRAFEMAVGAARIANAEGHDVKVHVKRDETEPTDSKS